jgi:V/A-type H+-transporting ATPase subunit I
MARVAVVAPRAALRDAVVRVAGAGCVEFDQIHAPGEADHGEAQQPEIATAPPAPDPQAGAADIVRCLNQAVVRDEVAALTGWVPRPELDRVQETLAPVGAAAVPLSHPRGIDPPTVLRHSSGRTAFGPLVDTYATVPYADVDPTIPAGLAYLVMFGAMFGDVGHGLLLVLGGLLLRIGWPRRLAKLSPHWALVAGAGLAAAAFGVLYGECFGPTGLVPALWLEPMAHPVPLLLAGIGLGAVLLAGAYALATVNRVREGGWTAALYAPSGLAGALLFLSAALTAFGWWRHVPWLQVTGPALGAVALVLAFVGLCARAGGGAGVVQAAVELFDMVIRLCTNVLSFARLAAFGLTHAVLGAIVWTATVALASGGGLGLAGAVAVFVIGNMIAFGLEALVAGVQALRLEYYELFSKVFQLEGRPFRPLRLPVAATDEPREEP